VALPAEIVVKTTATADDTAKAIATRNQLKRPVAGPSSVLPLR
jgi:hypothetical protein